MSHRLARAQGGVLTRQNGVEVGVSCLQFPVFLADAARLCFWAIERVTLHMIDVSWPDNETHFVHYLQHVKKKGRILNRPEPDMG